MHNISTFATKTPAANGRGICFARALARLLFRRCIENLFVMKKILLFSFLFLLLGVAATAQNIQLTGKVLDETKAPVEDLTVYLSAAKDSTLIQYANTDAAGLFAMDLSAVETPSFLTFSMMGYQDQVQKFDKITESKDLGIITMKEDSDLLSELVIVTDVPIRVKNDTLEFNASSFKTRPDANVQALLKQLPGVEIDSDNKITVNGRDVSQILVNGKPFFSEDGSIALQNLPADLIKKVQVTDLKTKAEEFSGRKAQSEDASINLTIDEENNKGLMGKITAGIGSIIDGSNRYESSGLINYFKGDRRISVLAMSNNINSTSFSMDDVFDNMGGGRSQFLGFGGRSGGRQGSSSGLTRTNMAGFNYSDQFFDDLDVNASYYFNDTQNKNNNRSRTVNLLPDGDFITESESQRLNNNLNHNANVRLEYTLNPTTKIFVNPRISSNTNDLTYKGSSQSMDENGALFNESTEESYSTSDSFTFSNSIQFNKKLNDNGQNFSVRFNNSNSKDTGWGHTNSATLFYQDNQPDDIRNQQEISRSTSDTYTLTAEYTQPVSNNTFLDLGYTFDYNNQTDVLNTYSFDETSGGFNDLNDRLSNETQTNIITNTPYIGIDYRTDKVFWNLNSGINIANYDASANYMSNLYGVDRQFVSPYVRAIFRYKFDQGKNASLSYNYNVTNPSVTQIMPYERLNNPLQTFVGNENLDQVKYHTMRAQFRNYNFQTRSGWSVALTGNYYDSQIISSTIFDENRKRTTTYENVADAYSATLFGNWNKTYRIDEHTIRYGISASGSYGKSKEFLNGTLTDALSTSVTPSVYVSWDYGDMLSIAPSYRVSFNHSKYNNFDLNATNSALHTAMLQTTSYWPANLTWGNDFSYNYNTRIANGFKKDYFMWNTSVAYTFLNKALTAKVKVYDLLNQNIGTSRTINPTSIIDQDNTVLERYVMFSLTWNFNKFGNQPSGKQGGRMGRGGRMRSM